MSAQRKPHPAHLAWWRGPANVAWRIERADTTGHGDWEYPEPINEAAIDLVCATGFSLPDLDNWIEAAAEWEPDALRHVMWCRHRMIEAVSSGNSQARDAFAFYLSTLMRLDHVLPIAALGQTFRKGRKPGAVGRVRKFVRDYMKKHPAAKAAEVWNAIKKKPPAKVEVFDTERMRYIRTESAPDTGYERFCNLVSQERPKK